MDEKFKLNQVVLNVNDLSLVSSFYEDLGFRAKSNRDSVTLFLNNLPLIILHRTNLPPKNEVGLDHLGFKVSSLENFISTYLHLKDEGISIKGGREFPCMKSIYFTDPEHNGLEIYVDLPLDNQCLDEEKRRVMTPLALDQLIKTSPQTPSSLPNDTIIGRIHLHVLGLNDSELYYSNHFGLTKTYEGNHDLFLSKDQFEDYVGLNTWLPGNPVQKTYLSPGLRSFSVRIEASLFDNLYGSKNNMTNLIDPNNIHSTVYRGL